MKQLFITIFVIIAVFINVSTAQNQTLNQYFSGYHSFEFDFTNQIDRLSDKSSFHEIKINLDGNKSNLLKLTPTQLFSDTYVRRETSANGEITSGIPDIYTFKGYVEGINDSYLRLTISDGFMNGYVRIGSERYIIQNMTDFDEKADPSTLIIYKPSQYIVKHPSTCGTQTLKNQVKNSISHSNPVKLDGDCYEVEIALAADWLMFQDHGSANNVEDQIVGVLDDVQGNYDDEFPDEILFEISEMFIVTSSSQDPWTNSTNAGDVLDSFRSWGQSGGFGGGYDVATLWTDRDFDGGTIGVAWLDALCSSIRYNTCQDYTSSSWGLRVLQAHEFGHNFGSNHDAPGSGFIMAPSVNNTNTWSASSINQIENHYTSVNCLDDCPSSGPAAPSANLSFDYDEDECSPVEVQFNDESTGVVDDYFWEFEGGTPSTSTDQNPTVIYFEGGEFDVSLTVSNSGGDDEISLNNAIEILDGTEAYFEYDNPFGSPTVSFDDDSENDVIEWYWDFGDGENSSEENPDHTYLEDGEYTVVLEVFNGDCYDEYEIEIQILTPPVADFEVSEIIGCEPFTVEFNNLSTSNAEDFYWEFEGGDPYETDEMNPTVTYNEPGVYNVFLLAENDAGYDEILVEDQITVLAGPEALFNNTIIGTTVEFENLSSNFDTSSWDFGDGGESNGNSPTYQYDEDGTYIVTLEVESDCGLATYIDTIEISTKAAGVILQDITEGCLPLTVTYDGSNSFLSENFDWTFEGAEPGTSNEQIVEVIYNEVGIYDVTLIVDNSTSSDTVTIENAVIVNDVPQADMSSINDALNFSLEAIPDGAFNTTYDWDFGDGNTAEGQMVTHSFSEEGIYTITLIASNECGSTEISQEFNLYTLPSSGFSASIVEGCVPMEVTFTNESSVNAEVFLWTFEGVDPMSSTEESPTVVYTEVGTYSVSLRVSNPAGEDELVQTSYIVVKDVPEVSFITDHDQTTISFENLTINGTSYLWDFGDGEMSNEENPTHIYEDEGEYWVTLTSTNECGPSELMLLINVTLRPTAGFSVESASGCAPFEVQYFDESSSNAEAWTWSFPGGNPTTSNEQNPIVTYNDPGEYGAELIVFGDGGSDTLGIQSVITALGLPQTFIQSNQTQNQVFFSSTNADVLSYLWDFGDGYVDNIQDPMHIYEENGTYLVTLTVTDECGSTTVQTEITINAFPVGVLSAENTKGCSPLLVEFAELGDNVTEVEWLFPGGDPATSTDKEVTVSYAQAGTYSITLISRNELGEQETVIEDFIVVDPNPTAIFNLDEFEGTVNLTNNSENATSYLWDFGDGNTSTEMSPSHSYDESGSYSVTLTAYNECGESVDTRDLTVEVLGDLIFNDFEIYPNPNDGDFNFKIIAQGVGNIDYQIVDPLDRLVGQGTLEVKSSQTKYSVSHPELLQGAYIIRVEFNEEVYVKKMIVAQ